MRLFPNIAFKDSLGLCTPENCHEVERGREFDLRTLGNAKVSLKFICPKFFTPRGVMDVRAFGSWMSAPNCSFSQVRANGPGTSAGYSARALSPWAAFFTSALHAWCFFVKAQLPPLPRRHPPAACTTTTLTRSLQTRVRLLSLEGFTSLVGISAPKKYTVCAKKITI